MKWGKRGAKGGGGGGGKGGGDPMQMISMVLMIVSLVIGLMGQCKEKKEKPKDIYEGQKELPGPSTPPAKKCSELNGFSCNSLTEKCRGDPLPAGDNTQESMCYSEKPLSLEEQEGKEQKSKSCAAQKGFNCGIERYCPNNQWVGAKDTQTCCQVGCVTRIQTSATFPHLGEVVVERFDGKSFGVWYGEDPQTKAFDANIGFRTIGHPNFAQARSIGKNKYEFGVEGKTYSFGVIKDEAAEIAISIG